MNYEALKLPSLFKSQKFYSLFASVFNSGIALFTFGMLTRALTKEEFGNWAFFLAIYGFIEMALNGMIRTPVIRMAANREEYDYGQVIASAWDIMLRMVLGLGLLGGLGFLAYYYLVTPDELILNISYWLPLYLIASAPRLLALWNSNAIIRFQRTIIIRAIEVSVFLIGVSKVYLYGGTFMEIFWYFLAANLITSVTCLMMGWSGVRLYLKNKRGYRREIISFGKYSMGTTIGSSGLNSSDVFIIMYLLGPEALALYEVPKRIIRLYDIPLRSVLQLTYPQLAKKATQIGTPSFNKHFNQIAGFSFFVLMPLAILIFIFATPIVTLLGGQEYASSGAVLRVFALYLMLMPVSRFSGIVLDVLNRPKVNFNKLMLMLLLNVIGDIVVLKLGYGVTGVAWVTVCAILLGIVYGYLLHRDKVTFGFLSLLEGFRFKTKSILLELRR